MKVLPPITDEDKMLSGLSYPLWPIAPAFVLYSSKREDPFLYFHALQGLAFGAVSTIAAGLVGLIVALLFRILPGSSTLLPGIMGIVVFTGGILGLLAIFLISLFLGWRASAGELMRLPVLGEWAETRMLCATGMTAEDFVVDMGPRERQSELPLAPVVPQGYPVQPSEARAEPVNLARGVRPANFGSAPMPSRRAGAAPSAAAGPLGEENNLLKKWLASADEE